MPGKLVVQPVSAQGANRLVESVLIPSAFTSKLCLRSLLALIGLFSTPLLPRFTAGAQTVQTHTVTWDSHSLLVDGKRILLFSGEFHYFRLPSPSEWADRLEKMKAAGLNAVSIYFDWQYHSDSPGTYDFSGVRDVARLLDLTERIGLYVIARVGPYMNGEADAGGLPGWLLTKPLYPRAQTWNGVATQPQYSPLYAKYSREWYDHLVPIIAAHQVTTGGSVLMLQIENEYDQTTGSQQYMQDLYGDARADGITVPIFHNDFWFSGNWSKLVDLYAFDSYPYGFSCCHQWWDTHFHGIDTWESILRNNLKITTPMFVSELQGGSFDPWGGSGYEKVANTLDGDWLSTIDQSALAQGTTILNTYMFVGGTSWGYMSAPDVYTSYDYGAPISESGTLRPSYYAAHRLGVFLDTYGSSLAAADATPAPAASTDPAVVVHARTDPGSGQTFIFLRHGDAGNAATTRLRLVSANSTWTIPQMSGTAITVPGHGSALLLTNAQIGPLHLNYSTSQVLTDAVTAQGHYLVLYGPDGTPGETDFTLPAGETTITHNEGVRVTRTQTELRLNYQHTSDPRTIEIQTAAGVLRLIVTNADQASHYWVAHGLLIAGPDLVAFEGGALKVWSSGSRGVRVYGAPANQEVIVDGLASALPDSIMGSTLLGSLGGPGRIDRPTLSSWKFAPESPEIQPSFDDGSWQAATHSGTSNPNVLPSSTLLADDYGFHYGFVWYRGHFTATGQEASLSITARHSYSVYLNGTYLGSADSPLDDPPHIYADLHTFGFPAGLLREGRDNVLSVLTESLGHDEGWVAGPAAQSPQGILTASLNDASTPIAWKIQGAQGGEGTTDDVRGGLNASGLFGERNGWYLPGYDDSRWTKVHLPDSWSARGLQAGVGWYRTHFTLNIPSGIRLPLGLTLPHISDKAVIFLNGWNVGRYWEQRGPQHTFYLPDGILNVHGDNTLAIAVWNRGHAGGLTAEPVLHPYAAMASHSVSLANAAIDSDVGYWHTQGNRIVDSQGHPVRIAGANWFGMNDLTFVPSGLDKQPLLSILARARALGINTIRLPFSNQAVESNPVVTDHLEANPDLKGLHVLDIMDRIVAAASHLGIRIILDDQRSTAGTDPEPNGLWYDAKYPESSWIADWQMLARRYFDNPTVVGVDIRNEPHTGPPGPWSVHTYLHQGATWGAYNGIENPKTDWRLAAERGGDAVLAVNPRLLIFVEGIQQYPNPKWDNGIESYWWGGILYPAKRYPVELSVPHQLVYSPHEYGPLKWQMPFFGPKMTYSTMKAVWDQHWGFLERSTFQEEAPVVVGEFGTCGQSVKCVDDTSPGSQGLWFHFLMRYLRSHPEVGWSFWALNGTNQDGTIQQNYILRADWRTIRLKALVDTLRDIEYPPPPAR
jgi:beta-galactosidase